MTIAACKVVDWTDACVISNRSTYSNLPIIVRPTVHGDWAVIKVDGSDVSIVTIKNDKQHAINYARRCAKEGWC